MSLIDFKGLEPFADLIKEIYGDLAKPGVQNVGQALEGLLGLSVTVMWPIMLLNNKAKISLENNMEKYRKKLENENINDISEVTPEVGVPILEKISYITNEELVELYTELLKKASLKSEANLAHPAFVNIINNLSPDEALLLKWLNENKSVRFMKVNTYIDNNKWKNIAGRFSRSNHGLIYPENISAYLSNFEGLGIITTVSSINEHERSIQQVFKAFYEYADNLERSIKYEQRFPSIRRPSSILTRTEDVNYETMCVTTFGELFLDAVLSKKPS